MLEGQQEDHIPPAVEEKGVRTFAILAEVAGYILSLAVLAGVLYTVFVRAEILASVEGELHPVSSTIESDASCVVLQYLAASGALVKAGDPVCRVVTDPQQHQAALVELHLAEAMHLLDGVQQGRFKEFADDSRPVLDALRNGEHAETLVAPVPGVFKPMRDSSFIGVVPPRTPLAAIYQFDALELHGDVQNGKTQDVRPGQLARLELKEWPASLSGAVKEVDQQTPATAATLRFDDPPEDVRNGLRAIVLGEGNLPKVKAEIVTGHHTLFKQIFGRTR